MYTKVFRQIYDGTLADSWQALVTFQQLLILADENGIVDMTPAAIHRTTGIPVDILEAGIAILEAPDHGSRTPDMEGRRIMRIDQHRAWGWFLVNFRKYRQLTTREEKKEVDRARIAEKRAQKPKENNSVANCSESSQPVASCSDLSPNVADVAYTDTDTEESPKGDLSPPPAAPHCPVARIIDLYHEELPQLARVRAFPSSSRANLRTRWREDEKRQNLDWWRKFFAYVRSCPFLIGQVNEFCADLIWLVGPKNFAKVINGRYEVRP